MKSDNAKKGIARAPHRSLFYAMGYTDEELDKCTAIKGDLLVCEGGDIGRSAIWNYEYDIRIQNHIHKRIYLRNNIFFRYRRQ